MALLSRSLTGRKKESGIWEYYEYCETTNKSICLVEIFNGKVGSAGMKGKNTTNLKVPKFSANCTRFSVSLCVVC